MMANKRSEELFLIVGLFFTQMIHCTWIFGNTSNIMLILANNVGRCGLFLFVCFAGGFIWKERANIKSIVTSLALVYSCSFILNIVVDILIGQRSGIKNIVLQFIRGTPGNIWIIYAMLFFSICILVLEKTHCTIPDRLLKIIGGGYCVMAVFLFCYANIYSGFISVDNGLILNVFYKVLGTNRSPYVLALPFLMLGACIEKFEVYKDSGIQKNVSAIVLFLLWCIEVLFINVITGNHNIHMTIIGAVSVYYIYILEKGIIYNGPADYYLIPNNSFVFYICLFAIQFSINRIVVYFLNLDSVEKNLFWFLVYFVVTFVVISFFHRVGDKNDSKPIK